MPYRRIRFLSRWICLAALVAVSLGTASASQFRLQNKPAMPRDLRHESRREIDQLEEKWRDAILHKNVQAMDALLADDYIAITSNGTLQSKEQTLTNLRNGTLRFTSLDFSDRKVRFYGQTALVTSRAEVNGSNGDGKSVSGSYRFTRVYVRDGKGVWRIVSFETSRIREGGDHK